MISVIPIGIYKKWLSKQNKEVKSKIASAVSEVENGNTSNCKPERDGIYEIKINFGQGVRLYYIPKTPTFFILVWGGASKKKQTADIEKAIEIKNFMRQNNQI